MGFFGSKEFWVAAVIASVVLVGAVAAFQLATSDPDIRVRDGCRLVAPGGTALAAAVNDSGVRKVGSHVERVVAYRLTGLNLTGGDVAACTDVGDVTVRPTAGGEARVVFTISSEGIGAEESVRRTEVEAAFTETNGGLGVAAREARSAHWDGLFSGGGASVRIEIEVPDTGAYAMNVETDVGDIEVRDVQLAATSLVTDVGDVDVGAPAFNGTMSLMTDVGDIEVVLTGIAGGTITVRTDVGDVNVRVPDRPDIGYHATARADVGDVEVLLGPGASRDGTSEGATERVEARSAAYDTRPTKVRVDVSTDVGDIHVQAR